MTFTTLFAVKNYTVDICSLCKCFISFQYDLKKSLGGVGHHPSDPAQHAPRLVSVNTL